MFQVIVLAAYIAVAGGSAQGIRSRPVTMPELTVPQEHLPTGCGLSPAASMHVEPNRVIGGLWGGLPIEVNPWTGTDRRLVALIRERVDRSPPPMPDGPPLSRRELARYRLQYLQQLADGVDEGYAAFYMQSAPDLIAVHALSFAETGTDHSIHSRRPNPNRIEIGSIVAFVSGDGGPCHQAVATYLRALGK